jgi:IPT/TIG domain
VTTRLPKVSGATVSALAGRTATVTGQYRTLHSGTARVTFTLPGGAVKTGSASIGLNGYYTVTVAGTPKGVTKVQVSIGGKIYQTVVVHGYPAPAPTVTSMSTHAGPAGGGTAVTIKGTNFRHVTGVYFGSTLVKTVTVSSPTALTVKAPAGKQATYVTVVTRDGGPSPLTGRSVFNFLAKPALAKLSPASGPAGGGTTVTITGSGFAFVTKVYFGAKLAAHVKVVSSREIKVSAPAGTGKVAVRVVTAGGTTPLAAGGYFSY